MDTSCGRSALFLELDKKTFKPQMRSRFKFGTPLSIIAWHPLGKAMILPITEKAPINQSRAAVCRPLLFWLS